MEDEVIESSVETGDTSVSEESVSQTESNDAPEQNAQVEAKTEEKPAPFHEHPRFKELIEQNRAFKEESSQRQQALEAMQRELQSLRQLSTPKVEKPKDQFLSDLEKINPEYAKSFQSVMDRAAKAEAVEQRLQQYEQAQFAERAVNHFNKLLESSKITDPMDRKLYERAIRAEVYEKEARGEKLGLKDLDKIFSEFHTEYSKAMEDRSRKLTASYVQEKTKDKAPKSTTGLPAAPGSKKLAAGDFSGQAKWLADQIRSMKKEH
jgi:hypothetical protein